MKLKPLLALTALAVAVLSPLVGAQAPSGPDPAAPAAQDAAVRIESRSARVARLEGDRGAVRAGIAAARSRLAERPAADQQALEARVAELERRLRELEAELTRLRADAVRSLPGTQSPADPAGLQPADLSGQTGQVTAGTAFNPSISVIPDGVFYGDNRQGAAGEILARAAGFGAGEADNGNHAHGGGVERGFSLRELEISFSGSVDPYFDAWAVVAVGDGEIEAEEAYVQTRKLVPGVQVRVGKFYSGIGYLNRQHPHQWDFVDQALPYELLFGGAVNEVGVQVNWLPALPFYALVGVEALQGENARISQHLGPEAAPFFRDRGGPRLFTGFLKVSPDIGYSSTLQAGASLGHSRLHQELHEEESGLEAFDGTSTFLGADLVYRFDSGKPWGVGDLTLQGEYLRRVRTLDLVALAGEAVATTAGLRFVQDGLYVQGVYGFAPRWTAAFRLDVAGLTNRAEGDDTARDDASRRYTANLTFNPTEFSRLRLQYARGDFAAGAGRDQYHQLWVQFQMSLGAHGAHRF